MAYQRRRKIYKLDFAGTEFEGLEVKMSGLTTGEYLEFLTLSTDGGGGDETSGMLKLFAKHLISWNLTDEEDEPVPTTYEGLCSNEMRMNNTLVGAWTDALVGVSDDLGKKSSSGDPSRVVSIPTEVL